MGGLYRVLTPLCAAAAADRTKQLYMCVKGRGTVKTARARRPAAVRATANKELNRRLGTRPSSGTIRTRFWRIFWILRRRLKVQTPDPRFFFFFFFIALPGEIQAARDPSLDKHPSIMSYRKRKVLQQSFFLLLQLLKSLIGRLRGLRHPPPPLCLLLMWILISGSLPLSRSEHGHAETRFVLNHRCRVEEVWS